MILYSLVKERIEERQRKREARGRELERRDWVAWNARRKAAEAAGEAFIEPNPAEKHDSASRNQG